MEVVRSNLKQHLDAVLEDIDKCSFISCDGEFTGISNDSFKAMSFDTVAERYEKLRKGNMDYLMCQVGICMFFQSDDGSYKVKPYNFYVLPRPFFNSVSGSPEFTCQASCIQFLACHGFDFNKVFLDGIPYLRPAEESRIKDKLVEKEEEKQSTPTSTPKLSLNAGDQQFVDDIIEKVVNFLQTEEETEPLSLEPCSAWRRKLTYQTLQTKFPETVHLQAAGEGKIRHIEVCKVNAEQKAAKQKEAFSKKLEELSDAVGFSTVVKAISHSGKVVIGHNMLLDLMYIISQFMAELPDSYVEFKSMASELFPKLIDTKVMSSTYLFKEDIQFNSLDEMSRVLESSLYQSVDIEIPEEFPAYHKPDKDTKFHDAAYDAYVTGKCFAIMAQHIGRKADPPVKNLASSSKLLTPFMNKLFVNRIQDIPYMNLAGSEVIPDRDHVFHLTFPSTWTRNDINQVFHPCLIYVQWIDDKSAMASLQKRTDLPQVKKKLKTKPPSCLVVQYHEWHRQKAPPTPVPSAGRTKPEKRKNVSALSAVSATPVKSAKLNVPKPCTPQDTEPSVTTDGTSEEPNKGNNPTEKMFEETAW